MKKYFLLIIMLGIFSCKNDDANTQINIIGNWQMTAFMGFVPELPQIEEGTIVWDIDNRQISMTNHSSYPYLSRQGKYTYQWVSPTVISVEYEPQLKTYYNVTRNNDQLVFEETHKPGDPEFSDAPIYYFDKIDTN